MNQPFCKTPYSARCVLVIACLLLSLTFTACDKTTSLPEEVNALTLKTLSGRQIALAELTSPILVSFWATNCVVCVREMPDLASTYRRYSPAGFELVAVAMPYDPPNLVLDMAEREQWPFPVALDVSGEVLASFASVKGTPTSFLIDKDGQLVKRYVGAIPIKKLEKQLEALLDLG